MIDKAFVLEKETKFNILLKALPTKGNIAWEYNPFRNYRLDEDLYEYNGYYYNLYLLSRDFEILLLGTIDVKYQTLDNNGNKQDHFLPKKVNKPEKPILPKDPTDEEKNIYLELLETYKSNLKDYEDYLKKLKKFFDNSDLIFSYDSVVTLSEENIEKNHLILEYCFKSGYNWNRLKLIQVIAELKPSTWYNIPQDKTDPILREKGELVDFITNELEFSLKHPVDIIPQDSYDDSVNLIMNDGYSYPKLINSRFSPRGRNTYEIVDRKGNADTNIYDRGELFKTDTSLYKLMNTFPKLKLMKISNGGALKVGNYFFYFRLADSDGNETDFFEESGLVSIFKGSSTYASISTGEALDNSFKQVLFQLTNLDTSYSYVNVYYSRCTSEAGFSKATIVEKIDLKYLINSTGISNVTITGFEPTVQLTEQDINLTYSLVDCAETSATCLNRLFLANVQKPYIDYETLSDLSLRFLPEAVNEDYDVNITNRYVVLSNKKGYIDPMYIYSKTGYWNKEIYRLGIVYIMKNGELSPVFNIRGAYNLGEANETSLNGIANCTPIPLEYNEDRTSWKHIEYNEENYKLLNVEGLDPNLQYENVKGVVRMNLFLDTKKVHYFKITTTPEVIEELKKHVKGFFFVRLHRIPTILAQGITIGVDKHGRVPTIPVDGADLYLSLMHDSLMDKTHVKSEDLNGLNYVSEGFMTRYKFDFKEKSSGLWKKIGKIVAVTIAIAAIVVLTVANPALGITAGGFLFTASFVGSVAICGAFAVGAVALGMVAAALILEGHFSALRTTAIKEYNGWETEVPSGYKIKELDESRLLDNDFKKRIIVKDRTVNEVSAILCPEFDVKQSYYNSIFCGNECYLESTLSQGLKIERRPAGKDRNPGPAEYWYRKFDWDGNRQFYISSYGDESDIQLTTSRIVALTDNQKTVAIDDMIFRGRAGEAEEAWRVVPISNHHLKDKSNDYAVINAENRTINSDYVRGAYGPYLAMEPTTVFTPAETINIYVPGYDPANYESYVMIRALDYSPYKAISERINIAELDDYVPGKTNLVNDANANLLYEFNVFRGDCYLCKYTHRFNRNFCDPSAPYNDEIVDPECWKNGFDVLDATKYEDINLGDVNAIQLGMWVTFDVRSTVNLNVLTLEESNVDEKAMTGHARGHYPQLPMSVEGSYKMAESAVYNLGMEVSLSERYNFLEPDVPYIKLWYGTRIMYSDIQVTDAFKNGYRLFWSTNYRDYPVNYGSITKILNWQGSLACIFEHGVAIIPVNERTVAGNSAGGNVYINTDNVLPVNPNMVSDKYGSQWKDSVIATDTAIYGVDTVAKKIWKYNGSKFELISDFCIQDFLNKHISLSERELEPILGIRNVKTHYNAFKGDVMFTFYDNLYDFEEEAWNLCYNEMIGKWITFYSWMPSFSENIYNQYFSFDRETSRAIAKLGICNADSDFADGVTLTRNLLPDASEKYTSEHITEYDKDGNIKEEYDGYLVGRLGLANRNIPYGDGISSDITYEIVRDVWKNYEKFRVHKTDEKDENGNTISNLYYLEDPTDLREEKYQRQYSRTWEDDDKKIHSETFLLTNPTNKDAFVLTEREVGLTDCAVLIPSEKLGLWTIKLETIDGKVYYYISQNKLYTKRPTSIYKDDLGRRIVINKDLTESDIIKFLNIRAKVSFKYEDSSKTYAETATQGFNNLVTADAGYFQSTIAITHEHNMELLTTDFWKHGLSGIIDIQEKIMPTYWYGRQHPFEFEFVVRDNPLMHKIFDNLEIISNKAAPESFHYEIVGECYDFANDKKNMYIRQEATKELYQYNGSNITYDHSYKTLDEEPRLINGTNLYEKSTIMPLYYARQDKIDRIDDNYIPYPAVDDNSVLNAYYKNNQGKDFEYLAGGEIVYYDTLNEYRIWNHAKAVDVNKTDYDDWTRANMYYKEDKWLILINPLNYVLLNETVDSWNPIQKLDSNDKPIGKKVPLNFTIFRPPTDIENSKTDIPEKFYHNYNPEWDNTENYQEAKLKDKFIKVRIRYSGEDLAVILAVNTLYSISYS